MSVDLNKIAEKLKNQRPLAVTKNGQLQTSDPQNDGTSQRKKGYTTLQPKRFFSPKKRPVNNQKSDYVYTKSVVDCMLSECYSRRSKIETGGILIGPKEHNRIITHAIPSGLHADRQIHTYAQTQRDVNELNKNLRLHQVRGREFRGIFHRHPSGMTNLSEGDKNTCLEIFNDPDYVVGGELLMIIITEHSSLRENSLPIFSYLVTLKNKNSVVVKPVNVEIMSNQVTEILDEYINQTDFPQQSEGMFI